MSSLLLLPLASSKLSTSFSKLRLSYVNAIVDVIVTTVVSVTFEVVTEDIDIVLSPGQTSSQVDATQRKFSTRVRLAFCWATHLRWLWSSSNSYAIRRKFAPFGHPTQVRTQVLVLQTYVDLGWLASPFGQGLKLSLSIIHCHWHRHC